jgi:hypothetical protein
MTAEGGAFHPADAETTPAVQIGVTCHFYARRLMKPSSGVRPVSPSGVSIASSDYLDVLRSEQFRFLDAMGEANEILRHESGRIALIAAVQNRLTQQFFDAQRSIIMRQAVYDAEVERIDRTADQDVEEIVAAARDRVRAITAAGRPLQPPAGAPTAGVEPPAPGIALALRTEQALADLPESAFDPTEPDPEIAQRQMAALLDQWWAMLNNDGQSQVDHAHARAAMRRHVAAIETALVEPSAPRRPPVAHEGVAHQGVAHQGVAPEGVAPEPAAHPSTPAAPLPPPAVRSLPAPVAATPPPPPTAPAVSAPHAARGDAITGRLPVTAPPAVILPPQLVHAIEAAPIEDLRALLESLDQLLQQGQPAVREGSDHTDQTDAHGSDPRALLRGEHGGAGSRRHDVGELVIRDIDPTTGPARSDGADPQATGEFWTESRQPPVFEHAMRVFPTRVVLPMLAATSALTLVLALVG